MRNYELTIKADELGLQVSDGSGGSWGIEWAEVYSLSGCKIDLIESVCTSIELDFSCGEFIEIHSNWIGFDSAIAAITVHLPGIEPTWYEHIAALDTNDEGIVVWTTLRTDTD